MPAVALLWGDDPSTSIAVWRTAVVLLAIVAVTELAIELFHAPRLLVAERTGCAVVRRSFFLRARSQEV